MKSRLILASAILLSLALPQAACAAAPQAAAPAAAPATAIADQEQLLAAERARLQAARAELAAQAAAAATPPAASRAATSPAAATAQPATPPAPVSPEVAGAPATPATADPAAATPDAAGTGAQPQTPSATGARPASPPAPIGAPGPVGGPSAGSLLQTILALSFVLALLAGLAWFMKRFGAKAMGGSANLRIVGSLNLGGRERLMVVEVGNQWIVVGASPGRVNALATMPKQEGAEQSATLAGHMPAASSFGEWLKQTIDKRNGK